MASYESTTRGRVRGVLIKDPTDLTAARPYGGTVLGATEIVVFRPVPRIFDEIAEEWGGEVSTSLYMGEGATLTTVLRGWDNDAIATIFPATEDTGGVKGVVYDPTGTVSGSVRAGTALSTFKLLFAPLNVVDHRAILFYDADVHVELTAEVQHGALTNWGLPIVFRAKPAGSSLPAYRWRKLADIPAL